MQRKLPLQIIMHNYTYKYIYDVSFPASEADPLLTDYTYVVLVSKNRKPLGVERNMNCLGIWP